MDFTEIAKYRLINQQLTHTEMGSVDMVEWFGAVQGQEYAQTKWGLALRLPHIKDTEIENELTEGKVLRTHLLRPTWHFVSATDICWLLTLTAPRVHASNAYMYRQLELNDKTFNLCINILVKILQGGKQLSRDSINEEFKKNKIIANGHRLSYIMMYAELQGIICSGARQGNQFTYALLDERIKNKKNLEKDEALSELTTRYFKSRGPATTKDFATWSGLTITDCKKGIEMIKSLLQRDVIENQEYFFTSNTVSADRQFEKIYLLPIYDEFVMGYKERNAMMVTRNNAVFRYDNMILFGGQVIGTWKRKIGRTAIDLRYDFFKPLNNDQINAFTQAVHRLSEFTGMAIDQQI